MKRWLFAFLTALALLASPTGISFAGAATPDTVILVLDASGSMAGAKITSAVDVGKNFLTSVPAGVKVGLVTFNSTDVKVIRPTVDYQSLSTALSAVKPVGDTALYDGILSAINSIGVGASARIVVLTDGDDTASKSLPVDVITAISKSGVALDVVTVGDATKQVDILKEFSHAGSGRLLQTKDAKQLTDVFTKVLASAPAVPKPTVVAPTPKPSVPATPQVDNSALMKSLGIAAITVAFLVGLVIGIRILKRRKQRRILDDALDPYATNLAPSELEKPKARSEFEPSDRDLQKQLNVNPTKSQLFPGLAEKLDRAGISLSAERWVIYWTIAWLLLTLGLTIISNSIPMNITFALLAAFLIQRTFLKSREAALKREFEEQLADFLTIIASGLRAGLSFAQAVESAVGDGTGEVERQIRRALAEVQVGSTLDAALMRVAKKMESDDLSWTIAALRIQREVGGNLSKILDTASVTIRNRAELKREVRTLSAEGRMSAYILVALPLGIFGFLLLSRRDYVKIFWTEPIGMAMLTMFVILVTAGWFWIRSVVTVKV
jgi:tight adherence protein B